MPLLSCLGNNGAIWLLAGITADWENRRKKFKPTVIVLLSLLTDYLLSEGLLKHMFNRSRPNKVLPDVRLLLPEPRSSSFPSTHALTSFSCAAVRVLLLFPAFTPVYTFPVMSWPAACWVILSGS